MEKFLIMLGIFVFLWLLKECFTIHMGFACAYSNAPWFAALMAYIMAIVSVWRPSLKTVKSIVAGYSILDFILIIIIPIALLAAIYALKDHMDKYCYYKQLSEEKEDEASPYQKITVEEFAKMVNLSNGFLNGLLNGTYEDLAKKNGIVMAYCVEEDLFKSDYIDVGFILEGAVDDAVPCRNGEINFINKDGIVMDDSHGKNGIKIFKNVKNADDSTEREAEWLLEADFPHEKFTYHGKTEWGRASCVGIVFNIKDLK